MKDYKLRYLPLFEDDLYEAVRYISVALNNPQAAERLLEETENAIRKRLKMPLAFEPYRSAKSRENVYYRIYVGNYTVFYVVIGDVMEVRRFIYGGRNLDRLL